MCCLLLLVGYPKFFRPAAPPNLGWVPPQIWDGCTHVVLKTGTDGKRGAVAIFGVSETPPFPVIQQNTRYSSSFRLLFPLPLSPVHALLVPLAGTIHGRERGQSLGYAFGVLRKADGEELGQSEIPLPDHSATPHVVLAD